ncbi:SIS domain-containing protein [Silvibacterium dinghuense]|uniref:SIS domain-containing protein n=1 Tax=Silvibacterium dinghuense TaxID=1560006 RepID=A0A4Q1SBJ7_9BACT|nr:SIS domain-containing protein [Silvibacterium dinghuense]RXS94389.1 SIS domain-containing protein [Silvibacterium dinghuense]GGH16423.1 tagatose-6-phosphate ketose isomerase [Silvibacterium dinghuense]
MPDPISALLALPEAEREARGLRDTPGEIAQQPETWRETAERLIGLRSELEAFLTEVLRVELGAAAPVVILVGAGTSDYIGRAVSRVLRQRWGCEVQAVPSTELLTNFDDFVLPERRYLFVSFSRSGESSEGVAVLAQALERYGRQVRHLVITCNAQGAMAKFPGVFTVELDARVNDRGLAMTSSFTNMVLAGIFLGFVTDTELYARNVAALADAGARVLPQVATVSETLADQGFSRMCFLGSGCLQAVADESSLKVLELNAGKIPTIAQSALGLRHGPLSFVDEKTLVVAFLSGDELRQQYELDLLEEIREKQLGGGILVMTPQRLERLEALTPHVIDLQLPAGFPDAFRPPVDVLAGQLLGLFFSIRNGIPPDAPSTGAISRVVSHVKIYNSAVRSR